MLEELHGTQPVLMAFLFCFFIYLFIYGAELMLVVMLGPRSK